MGPKWGSRSAQRSGSAPPTPLEHSSGTRRPPQQPRPASPSPAPPALPLSLRPSLGGVAAKGGGAAAGLRGRLSGWARPPFPGGGVGAAAAAAAEPGPLLLPGRPLCSPPHAPGRSDAAASACCQRCPRGSRSQRPGPCTPLAPLAHPAATAAAMPSAKQRGSKGGHGAASPSDKGAHPSGGADDVAKKPPPAPQQPQPPAPHPPQQHPQNQAHRGGHRARSSAASSTAAAASSASCSRRLGRLLNFLFYLALVAAAAFSGWCVHHVLEEVQQVRRGHQDLSRERDELGQSLQGVEQKVGIPALVGSGPHSCPP